jgi:hypothetical protein
VGRQRPRDRQADLRRAPVIPQRSRVHGHPRCISSRHDIARIHLPRPDGFALQVAIALRTGIATVVPFYLAIALDRPMLMWAALGGWLGALADPGGERTARIHAIAAFTLVGGAVVIAGLAVSPFPLVAACLFGAIVLAAAHGRFTSRTPSVYTILAVAAAIATGSAHPGSPVVAGALFALGAGWTVLLSSIVWGGRPARRPVPQPPDATTTAVAYAARLAIATLVAVAVGRVIAPHHISWVTVTTLAVLQPSRGATWRRLVERIVGTVAGCVIVIALTHAIAAPLALAVAMLVLSASAIVVRLYSYPTFVALLTPVFLLVADQMHTAWSSIGQRILAVAAGGAIAVLATLASRCNRGRVDASCYGDAASIDPGTPRLVR